MSQRIPSVIALVALLSSPACTTESGGGDSGAASDLTSADSVTDGAEPSDVVTDAAPDTGTEDGAVTDAKGGDVAVDASDPDTAGDVTDAGVEDTGSDVSVDIASDTHPEDAALDIPADAAQDTFEEVAPDLPAEPCGGACPDGQACIDDACVSYSARPVHPLSTSMATTQRPLFQVDLTEGADGTRVEICTDHACQDILVILDLDGDQGTPDESLAPGVIYWRATAMSAGQTVGEPSVVWQLRIGHGTTDVSTSWGSMFDYNLDGYADAVVGACGIANCTQKVFIHTGGPDGLSTTPTSTLENPNTPFFGFAVGNAGDVNGDGYPDLVVGTGFGDAAALYLSGPEGIASEPVQSWAVPGAWYGFSAKGAGDVNGDGYGDIIVGAMIGNLAFIYYGGPDGPGPVPDVALSCPGLGGCGVSVAGAGDFNGDRYGDVIVGAATSNEAYVYHGGPEGMLPDPVETLSGTGNYGTSVDVAGDVNGDGYIDVIVGAPDSNVTHIYLGSADGIAKINKISKNGGLSYGISVSDAGDVNGDGLSDVIIGGKYFAELWLGDKATGLSLAPITLLGATPAFGDSVAGVGDTDGNGLDDVLVGATDEDKSYLYLGDINGFPTIPSVDLIPGDGTPGYGFAVAELRLLPRHTDGFSGPFRSRRIQ